MLIEVINGINEGGKPIRAIWGKNINDYIHNINIIWICYTEKLLYDGNDSNLNWWTLSWLSYRSAGINPTANNTQRKFSFAISTFPIWVMLMNFSWPTYMSWKPFVSFFLLKNNCHSVAYLLVNVLSFPYTFHKFHTIAIRLLYK